MILPYGKSYDALRAVMSGFAAFKVRKGKSIA
jgi:hypothetical protein